MDEKKKQPPYLVALLATAGLVSLPQAMKMQQEGQPAGGLAQYAGKPLAMATGGDEDEDKDQDVRDLRPLLDYLSDGKSDRLPQPDGKPGRPTEADLKKWIDAGLPDELETPSTGNASRAECTGKPGSVSILIVSLPDPIAGAASPRFDEYLDVLQRAIELQGFVLDRFVLPWRKATQGAYPTAATGHLGLTGLALDLRVEAKPPAHPKIDRPGLMVFRDPFPPQDDPSRRPALILAFLVPESPVSGLNKTAFARSLDLIERYFHARLTDEKNAGKHPAAGNTPRKVLRLLTPCFSGSQVSIETVLRSWAGPERKGLYHFRILSSHANQIEEGRLKGLFEPGDDKHRLTFHSMVHKSTKIREEMIKYLHDSLGYGEDSVAILIESNTGLSQALFRREQDRRERERAGQPGGDVSKDKEYPAEFIFPLQISELRKAYAKDVASKENQLATAGTPERLTIPPDEAGTPRDLPSSYTPDSSAAIDEMSLTQVLTTISHRKYFAVGIVATNPLDVVFLARQVRMFCPNVRLFAIQSDLLLSRPQEVPYLRGMLLASTYPLYPPNQWLSTASRSDSRVFFSDQGSQGLYNATVAHLWEMGVIKSQGPPLLEYSSPYDLSGPGSPHRPPVWISAVGERGLYPISFVEQISYVPDRPRDGGAREAEEESVGYLYEPLHSPEGRKLCLAPPPRDETSEQKAARLAQAKREDDAVAGAMRPNPHLLFWILCLSLIVACVGVAGFTWLYVGWANDGKKETLKTRIWGVLGFGHALRFCNAEVAKEVGVELRPDAVFDPQERFRGGKRRVAPRLGADLYVLLINLLVFVPSEQLFSLVIEAFSPYVGSGPGLYIWFAIIVVAISAATASLVLGVIDHAWRHLPGQAARARIAALKISVGDLARLLSGQAARPRTPPPPRGGVRADSGPSIWPRGLLFLSVFIATAIDWINRIRISIIFPSGTNATRRLLFERLTNLPSGVSPIFPSLFLTAAIGAWVYAQLARRRLYRLTYLSTKSAQEILKASNDFLPFQHTLYLLRKKRETLNELISNPYKGYLHVKRSLLWVLALALIICGVRLITRGLPRSFEGIWNDRLFWSLFAAMFVLIVGHSLLLLGLWRNTRSMLRLAIELPMRRAFDRIPPWLKRWFFGEEDLAMREQVVLQQVEAVRSRSTPEFIAIYRKLFPDRGKDWEAEGKELRESLGSSDATLDSTRSVYEFLSPLWSALSVGGMSQSADGEKGGGEPPASWPLMSKDLAQDGAGPPGASNALTPREQAILRDWAIAAEDLVAIQIVRWFAPALSQLLPIVTFLATGAMALLLAAASYPFDHQGWLMTVMVGLLLFVTAVAGYVLIGVNRDELISRVSNASPGLFGIDSSLLSSLLTVIVPLLAALLAVSYDLSDILHTWVGPLIQSL